MAKPQRQQDPDIELESDGPIEGVAHKRRNDSPEAVALRMHREARQLAARQVNARARLEEIDAKCKAFAEARAALPEETRKLLDRLVAP